MHVRHIIHAIGIVTASIVPANGQDTGSEVNNSTIRLRWTNVGNGIIEDTEQIEASAEMTNDSQGTVTAAIRWTVESDGVAKAWRVRLKSTNQGNIELEPAETRAFSLTFTPPAAGFYRFTCTAKLPDAPEVNVSRIVGYKPRQITSPLTRAKDFDEFWRTTLRALAEVQPQFSLEHNPGRDSKSHEVYAVSMRSLENVTIRGWYQKPKGKGKRFPVILRVPGYGQEMQPDGEDAELAYFSLNIRGHGNSCDDVPRMPENYWLRGLDDETGYFYQGAYADCLRAVDFLMTRSELDHKRIAITGASQGGGLSLAAAALDSRIAVCAPDIPFLCDWNQYFRTSHWPEMDEWIAEKPMRTWATTLQTLSYFDTMNMAHRIECPVFASLGVQDQICPPRTIFATFNRLAGPKEFRSYANAGHYFPTEHAKERNAWIKSQLEMLAR